MSLRHDFRMLHGSHMPHCDACMQKRFDGYHSLQFASRGSVLLRYDDAEHLLAAPCFWFHYPGPLIRLTTGQPQETWSHRYVAFSGALCQSWLRAGLIAAQPTPCPAHRRAEFSTRLDDILGWMHGNAAAHGSAPANKARAALELLLWELWEIRRHPETARHQPVLAALAEFAAVRRYHAGSYPVLAKQLGLSLSSLRRHVHEATGAPLHHYTRHLRLAEARRLLRTTDDTLDTIAEALGFADAYYFNREFTRLAGISPGAYRKSLF
ncbi:MAG: helix-turn-helix transcriptional regulator [Candidatus Methylacidiphilales bacterium]|nr:helix-turn-helix transcriptional regulator [Candidatus Methylacidiphilales bacterium]